MSAREDLLDRLNDVEPRLRAHAGRRFAAGALTAPDPPSGERWEPGQVWAHLAEFIPYWLKEAAHVVEGGGGEPAPFGRTKSDTERIAAIERDRRTDPAAVWERVAATIATLRRFLTEVDEAAWRTRGLHPTLGVMDLAQLLHEFLVGHLEQHADQLDDLGRHQAGTD